MLTRSQKGQVDDLRMLVLARGEPADLLGAVQAAQSVGGSPAGAAAQELLRARGFGDRELTADPCRVLAATDARCNRSRMRAVSLVFPEG